MPFPLMTLRSRLFPVILCVSALPALLVAQTSSSEEARLEQLMANSSQMYVPRTTVSIGFRVLNSGGNVTFGNLGQVAFDLTVPPASEGAVDRLYDNGAVRTDSPRLDERDENGNQTSTPGGRYPIISTVTIDVVDDAGNVIGTEDIQVQTADYLAYTPGLTRNWGYGSSAQITPDGTHVAMSTYSASSEGASAMTESEIAAGVEFQYVHTFSKPTKRLQWGVMGGVALNGINSKTAGSVTSTLNARTDYYSLAGGAVPQAPYQAPSFDDYLTSTGEVLRTDGLETTVPISAVPDAHIETSTPGGATVVGNWQVKGAYFMVRVGPTLRTQLSPRFGISASFGLAGAYAGSTYSVVEAFQVPDLPDLKVGTTAGTEANRDSKFLAGYYADLNFEWAASERTGLFTGVTAQQFDGYDQEVGGRTARIDLGSAVGLRGGVNIKF
jgi:hypothetical protein